MIRRMRDAIQRKLHWARETARMAEPALTEFLIDIVIKAWFGLVVLLIVLIALL